MDENLERVRKWTFEHQQEMSEELSRYIRIPSVRDDLTAEEGKPFGKEYARMLEYVSAQAKE